MDLRAEEATAAMPTWGRTAPVARRDKGGAERRAAYPSSDCRRCSDKTLSEIPGTTVIGKNIDE